MAESAAFTWAAELIERRTSLNRLQSRGVLRIVLRKYGIDPPELNRLSLSRLTEQAIPEALRKQGVEDYRSLARELAQCPANLQEVPRVSALDIFDRLGGRMGRR